MTTNKRRGSACSEGEALRGAVLPDKYPPEVTDEDVLRCDIWVTCSNPYCYQSGCVNAQVKYAKKQRKEGKS